MIRKEGEGTYPLTRAHQQPPLDANAAQRRWRAFEHKERLTEVLHDEQYGLCAYSELRPDQAGIGMHIEHIVPKWVEPQRTFELAPFFTASRQRFGAIAEHLLATDAPMLV